MSREYQFRSRNMFAGEVLRKGITIAKGSGNFLVTSAKVTVYNASTDAVVTAEANASTSGDGTSSLDVYALISAGSTTGLSLYVLFAVVDGSYTVKGRLDFNVV